MDKLINSDNAENLKLFKGMKTATNMSSYSDKLNRIFKYNSFDYFYDTMVLNRKYKRNQFKEMFTKDETKSNFNIKNANKNFNKDKFIKCLKKMTEKDNKTYYKVKHPYTVRQNNTQTLYSENFERIKNKFLRSKQILPEVPDIGKYNPNYNSIRKYTFHPFFGTQKSYSHKTEYKENTKDTPNKFIECYKIIKENNKENKLFNSSSLTNVKEPFNLTLSKKCLNFKETRNNNPLECLLTHNSEFFDNNNTNRSYKSLKENDKTLMDKHIINNFSTCNSFKNTLTHSRFISLEVSPRSTLFSKTIKNQKSKNFENIRHLLDEKIKSKFQTNHALKFESYTARKPLIIKHMNFTQSNEESSNKITTESFIKNKANTYRVTGNIKFNKMSTGKNNAIIFEEDIKKSKDVPSIGLYSPNYSSIYAKVQIPKFIKKKKMTKKDALNKIKYQYDVPLQYQIISKLNEN